MIVGDFVYVTIRGGQDFPATFSFVWRCGVRLGVWVFFIHFFVDVVNSFAGCSACVVLGAERFMVVSFGF